MLTRSNSYRSRRRRGNVAIIPQLRYRGDPEFIFNPTGSQILSLPGVRRPVSPSRMEVPCRPRKRHDPSLVDFDMTNPPLPVDDEDDEYQKKPVIHRHNPCCLCKVGFYHGALNFALITSGVHFFLMFYCIYVILFTRDYTVGFLKFWDIKTKMDPNGEEMKQLLSEVHAATVVGSVAELLGLIFGIWLIVGLVKEKAILCKIWCVLSCLITAIEIFGVAFLAARLSFMILIPIPVAILVQIFGLWVIIQYVRALGDPRICPVCHQLIQDHPEPSDHSLPTLPLYHPPSTKSKTTTTATQKSSATTATGVTFDEEDERLRSWRS